MDPWNNTGSATAETRADVSFAGHMAWPSADRPARCTVVGVTRSGLLLLLDEEPADRDGVHLSFEGVDGQYEVQGSLRWAIRRRDGTTAAALRLTVVPDVARAMFEGLLAAPPRRPPPLPPPDQLDDAVAATVAATARPAAGSFAMTSVRAMAAAALIGLGAVALWNVGRALAVAAPRVVTASPSPEQPTEVVPHRGRASSSPEGPPIGAPAALERPAAVSEPDALATNPIEGVAEPAATVAIVRPTRRAGTGGPGVASLPRVRGHVAWTERRASMVALASLYQAEGPSAHAPAAAPLTPEDAARRTVNERLGMIQHCYDQALRRDPDREGQIVVEFTAAADGRVRTAAIVESSARDDALGACVHRAMRTLTLSGLSEDVVVRVPFLLKRPVGI